MKSQTLALVFSIVMVFSSFVGCIDTEEENVTDDVNTDIVSLGNVMVSTYHVAELVRAVGGDRVNVEIISPSNVPVHDYEPSAADLIKLQDVDLFFYHGLNLEPWVDATISSLGSDAPLAVQTHAMPTGENTLDYQSMLLSELCEHLNEGPNEMVTLSEYEHKASEVTIHAEHVNHKITFPELDDHGDEGGHDDHGDEGDHDDHAGHNHAAAEKVIENPTGCPSDTSVSIFHFEEGEYVLEFEYSDSTNFDMVVLKMAGGHAHHDHHGHDDHGDEDGHDDHGDEDSHDDHGDAHDEHGEDHCEDSHSDDHGDEDGHGDEENHDDHNHGDEDDHDSHDHDEHGHDEHGDEEHDEVSAACVLELHDTNKDSHLSWDEFWHAWTNNTDDDDHGDDDHGDHEGEMEALMELFNESDENNDQLLNLTELDNFIHMLDAGDGHHAAYATLHIEEEGDYGLALPSGIEYFILKGEGGHDDHGDDHDDHSDHSDEHSVCHDTTNHVNTEYDNEADCEAAGHMWIEDHSDEQSEIAADEGEEAFDYDPHSWLNPVAFKAQVDVVLNALITAFPDGEVDFKANAEAYSTELDKLDLDYTAAFGEGGTCEASNAEKTIVANHNAYAYISERYDIEILTVHGLDPEGAPSAADIVKVVEQIEEKNIKVLYVEEYTDTSSVDSIVQQTGVTIEILYTMELPPKNSEDTYLTLMGKNLNSLVEGMGC